MAGTASLVKIAEAREHQLAQVLRLDREFSPVFSRRTAYAQLLGAGGLLLVALRHQCVCSFAAFSTVMDEATLLNLVVHPGERRRGLARALLREAWTCLGVRGVHRVLLELRQSNAAARALYEAESFAVDGYRKAYYPAGDGSREAAVLMSRTLAV